MWDSSGPIPFAVSFKMTVFFFPYSYVVKNFLTLKNAPLSPVKYTLPAVLYASELAG